MPSNGCPFTPPPVLSPATMEGAQFSPEWQQWFALSRDQWCALNQRLIDLTARVAELEGP